jgi:hypothetical protein
VSHIESVFFPANTTSLVQSLDQGILRSFKCFYRQLLVKHIIVRCTTACNCDRISVNPLDACRWIDLAWNRVIVTVVSNCFLRADFGQVSSDQQSPYAHALSVDGDESTLKQLDDLLFYVDVDDDRMSVAELVSIDDDIPVFNQWTHEKEAIREMMEVNGIEEPAFVEEEE